MVTSAEQGHGGLGAMEKLDNYYNFAKTHILRYQNCITGLFPSSLDPKPEVACVRESLYCALSVFALGRAYGRVGYDGGRRYELTGSAVKCMRGILECWLRQATCVEKFKKNQCDMNALHSKFDIVTGLALKESTHNIQIDIVALYLVLLVEMTSSGYKIVSSPHEVSFVQNLVYYIERAYRTPDWSMWECGSRYEKGTKELNASATGLAKAALESMNGFNLYGDSGASWSVIYVDADAHQRNRTIFETILPKQSSSKPTDAALLPVVLWPGYACNDAILRDSTVNRLLDHLSGKYGVKRFLRDGFGIDLQDLENESSHAAGGGSRESETKKYASIECEWPMFYLYIVIDRMLRGQPKEAKHLFSTKIEPFLAHSGLHPAWGTYGPRLPAYYFISPPEINNERVHPGTAHKLPSQHAFTSQMPCLWAQSLLLISQLLLESHLDPDDLDPIGRRAGHTGDYSLRYSSFQLRPAEPVVQVIVIAESLRLQQFLATYGIVSQTPRELDPVRIWSPNELIRAYENLGTCQRLGLTGRPIRPIGTLGCAKTYSVCGTTVLCYVVRFNVADFYLFHDTEYVIEEVRADLQFLSACWRMAGRPTYCLLLREDNFKSGSAPLIFNLLAEMRQGQCSGVHVQLARLQVAMSQACVEHLDFIDDQQMTTFRALQDREMSLEDSSIFADIAGVMQDYHYTPSPATDLDLIAGGGDLEGSHASSTRPYAMYGEKELTRLFSYTESLTTKAHILFEAIKRYGINTEVLVAGTNARKLLELLYEESGTKRHWLVVRLCAAMLQKAVDSVAPEITMALVRGKRVSLGVIGKEEHVIEQPLTPSVLHRVIYDLISPYNVAEAVLQQELIILTGRFITLNPKNFEGILTIRIGCIVQAMELQLARDQPKASIWGLSPAAIKELFSKVLKVRHIISPFHERDSPQSPSRLSHGHYAKEKGKARVKFQVDPHDANTGGNEEASLDGDLIAHLRMVTGALNRVPAYFYPRVWEVLERAVHGLRIGGSLLPQQPTLSDLTQDDAKFAFNIESMLSRIDHPARRQLTVEALMVVWTVLHRNPELKPSGTEPIDIDAILQQAVEDFRVASGVSTGGKGSGNNSNEEMGAIWEQFYRLDPGGARGTCSLLARALVSKLFSAGFTLPPADSCAVS